MNACLQFPPKAEEEDFGLVSQINDLTLQVDGLENANSRAKHEIEKYKGQGERGSQNRQRIKEGLEAEIEQLETKVGSSNEVGRRGLEDDPFFVVDRIPRSWSLCWRN
jgi:hypothetical protein